MMVDAGLGRTGFLAEAGDVTPVAKQSGPEEDRGTAWDWVAGG